MTGTKNNNNGSDETQKTKLSFEDADESMYDGGDNNADVADDITSADYYFDSYSHFGKIIELSLYTFAFFMLSYSLQCSYSVSI